VVPHGRHVAASPWSGQQVKTAYTMRPQEPTL
jgi:hypothetical protein